MNEKMKKIKNKIKCYAPLFGCILLVALMVGLLFLGMFFSEREKMHTAYADEVSTENTFISNTPYNLVNATSLKKYGGEVSENCGISYNDGVPRLNFDFSRGYEGIAFSSLSSYLEIGKTYILVLETLNSSLAYNNMVNCTYSYDEGTTFSTFTVRQKGNYPNTGVATFYLYYAFTYYGERADDMTDHSNRILNFNKNTFVSLGILSGYYDVYLVYSPNINDLLGVPVSPSIDYLQESLEDYLLEREGAGYDLGYEFGYDDGYNIAYNNLRDEVESEVMQDKNTFLDGLFSILDAPVRIIRTSLNFEIFGLNIANVVFFGLTCALVIFVIMKLRGK